MPELCKSSTSTSPATSTIRLAGPLPGAGCCGTVRVLWQSNFISYAQLVVFHRHSPWGSGRCVMTNRTAAISPFTPAAGTRLTQGQAVTNSAASAGCYLDSRRQLQTVAPLRCITAGLAVQWPSRSPLHQCPPRTGSTPHEPTRMDRNLRADPTRRCFSSQVQDRFSPPSEQPDMLASFPQLTCSVRCTHHGYRVEVTPLPQEGSRCPNIRHAGELEAINREGATQAVRDSGA